MASGYHSAVMDEIADRAGVSKPVLYQHFPGKRDLYLAVLDQHIQELESDVRRALASTTENKQRVAATIQAYFSFIDRDDAPFRLVFESDLTGDEEVRERVARSLHTCSQAIAAVIQEDTGLPRARAELLGVALSGMASVTARYWTDCGDPIPLEEAVQLVSQLSWRGIGGFPKAVHEPVSGASGDHPGPGVG